MAARGTVKRYSVDHETHIAQLFDGRRSPASGASVTDPGDVSTDTLLIECKMTLPDTGKTVVSKKIIDQFTKIAQESWEHGKDPALALRYYDPASPLAARDGWVDFVMMLASDLSEKF